jgi:hypothetical protein
MPAKQAIAQMSHEALRDAVTIRLEASLFIKTKPQGTVVE